MSVNIVNKTTGDLTRVAGNATDKVGNLDALTTTDKTSIVGGVNEINAKIGDVSNTLADYASLDIYISNSGDFPDANNVTKELVYINGWQSGLTNYPSEVFNTAGILFTRWFYYSGDLTVARMQLVFTLGGLSFCRFTDGTSWTPWQSTGVGILSNLTTTDKSSVVAAINEVNGKLTVTSGSFGLDNTLFSSNNIDYKIQANTVTLFIEVIASTNVSKYTVVGTAPQGIISDHIIYAESFYIDIDGTIRALKEIQSGVPIFLTFTFIK